MSLRRNVELCILLQQAEAAGQALRIQIIVGIALLSSRCVRCGKHDRLNR